MSPEIRLRLAPLFLLCALIAACGGDNGPSPTTGAIDLLIGPGSSPLDPDGFAFSVDQGAPRAVPETGEIWLENLSAGPHELALADVDEPCEVTGDNPQTVTVPAGDTIFVFFNIACNNTADIVVTTMTTGEDLDPDGYLVSINGNEAPAIGVNEAVTYSLMVPGEYQVTLSGLAPNCAVQGSATRSGTVGPRETAHVDFEVVCTPLP